MDDVVTLEDVLRNVVAASIMVQLLELKDKRNLRLACHAGQDAVDRTVTSASLLSHGRKEEIFEDYAHVLANSNWRGLQRLRYDLFDGDVPLLSQRPGINQIAEAGFSKLETLSAYLDVADDITCAEKIIQAGWKLKQLAVDGPGCTHQWYGIVVRDAHWPLEELYLTRCSDGIARVIATANWLLESLSLVGPNRLSPQGVESLLQGSWVSTLEWLEISTIYTGERGARAIAEASHRAVKLETLRIINCISSNSEALLLGEGHYPKVKELNLRSNDMGPSGLAAILKKCPAIEVFDFDSVLNEELNDPDDAAIIGKQLHRVSTLDFTRFWMTKEGVRYLFEYCDWPKLEHLSFTYSHRQLQDIGDEIIAGLVQRDWPCLKSLVIQDVIITSEGFPMLLQINTRMPSLSELQLRSEDIFTKKQKRGH